MEELILIGKKLNMTQIFNDEGRVIPVTRVLFENLELSDEAKGKPIVVVGTSKGKGFTGVMKRWNFKRQHVTRGSSNKIRTGGSIGAQTPSKVFKGKKMAGRSGGARVTVKGLKIVDFISSEGIVLVSGPVPGARNSEITLKVQI